MVEVKVRAAGAEYPVLIGKDLYENEFAAWVRRTAPAAIAVVSHATLLELHGPRIRESLASVAERAASPLYFLFPAGEEHKDLRTVEKGYITLLDGGFNREGVIIAFGGGVVGDLAGYMAATYMRGTRFVQLPTTLMAMVDSSIGGKVGVDLPGAKNAVGSFHQPQAVFSDVAVLETLPGRELRAGMAEVAKYGFLFDAGLLQAMQGWPGGSPQTETELSEVIARCVAHKAAVVERDERDLAGERALLNYGHTFGHALESAIGYGTLRHGEAVAVGMMMAARLSELCGLSGTGLREDHLRVLLPLLRAIELPEELDIQRVMGDMRSDKKRGAGARFVLLERPQVPRLVENPPEGMIRQAVVEVWDELRGVQ